MELTRSSRTGKWSLLWRLHLQRRAVQASVSIGCVCVCAVCVCVQERVCAMVSVLHSQVGSPHASRHIDDGKCIHNEP